MTTTIKSIGVGKDYTSVQAWYDARNGDLVGETRTEIGEVYGTISGTNAHLDTAGTDTTNATYYMTLRAGTVDSSEGHNGTWGSGNATLEYSTVASTNSMLYIRDDYFVVENLQLKYSTSTGADILYWSENKVADYQIVRNNLIRKTSSATNTYAISMQSNTAEIYRNVIFSDSTSYGFNTGVFLFGDSLAYANTVAWYSNNNSNSAGFISYAASTGDADPTVKNNLVHKLGGVGGNDFRTKINGQWDTTNSGYNFATDTSAPGSNNIDSGTVTDTKSPGAGTYAIVESLTSGSEDYTLYDNTTDNDAQDAGENLGSPYDTDIAGNTVTGTWDIGAFEVTSGAATVTPNAGALALDGKTPSLGREYTLKPNVGALSIDGKLPSLGVEYTLKPNAGSLTIDGKQPSVTATTGVTVTPNAGALTIDGKTPELKIEYTLKPSAGALTLDGKLPSLSIEGDVTTLTPNAGALTIDGKQPSVIQEYTLKPSVGALTIDGKKPQVASVVQPKSGAITIDGKLASLIQERTLKPAAGSITVDGRTPSLWIENTLYPLAGTLTITGQTPTVRDGAGTTVTPNAGILQIMGKQPVLVIADTPKDCDLGWTHLPDSKAN